MAGKTRDWAKLTANHKARGAILINLVSLCEEQSAQSPLPTGKRGRPRQYSPDLYITLLTLKVMLQFPLRAIQGLAEAMLEKAGVTLSIPDYSLLSRRAEEVKVELPPVRKDALWLVADGTGLKITGEGEWKCRQHGVSKRRKWKKTTLLIDPETGIIHNVTGSSSDVAEITCLPDLLAEQDLTDKILVYDGAADTRKAYQCVADQGGILLCPPRHGARRWLDCGKNHPRNRALRDIGFIGRDAWKDKTGYHRRSLAETAMHRLKSLTGNSMAFRTEANQAVELLLRAVVLNAYCRGSFA